MKYFFSLIFILTTLSLSAQSPIGTWKSVDDDSGEARSHVEIYEQGGMLFGKITKLLIGDSNAICDRCSGSKKNKPMLGLVIIENMKPEGDSWKKGKILDPEDGKEFDCEIWVEEGTLKVRGKHWTGLYRTQTWFKVK
ncbi:MAG: DUF2147 domain-containing protein [Bacteroidota bacterium]